MGDVNSGRGRFDRGSLICQFKIIDFRGRGYKYRRRGSFVISRIRRAGGFGSGVIQNIVPSFQSIGGVVIGVQIALAGSGFGQNHMAVGIRSIVGIII